MLSKHLIKTQCLSLSFYSKHTSDVTWFLSDNKHTPFPTLPLKQLFLTRSLFNTSNSTALISPRRPNPLFKSTFFLFFALFLLLLLLHSFSYTGKKEEAVAVLLLNWFFFAEKNKVNGSGVVSVSSPPYAADLEGGDFG